MLLSSAFPSFPKIVNYFQINVANLYPPLCLHASHKLNYPLFPSNMKFIHCLNLLETCSPVQTAVTPTWNHFVFLTRTAHNCRTLNLPGKIKLFIIRSLGNITLKYRTGAWGPKTVFTMCARKHFQSIEKLPGMCLLHKALCKDSMLNAK